MPSLKYIHWSLTSNIKIEMGSLGSNAVLVSSESRALMMKLVPIKEKTTESWLSPLAIWAHSEIVAFYKPRREIPPEPDYTATLISDFQSLKLWKKKIDFCCASYTILVFCCGNPNWLIHTLYAKQHIRGSCKGNQMGQSILFLQDLIRYA